MLPTRPFRVALLCLAVAASACGNPTLAKAYIPSAASTFSVYTLTNSPATVPNALSFLGGPSRAGAGFNFDLAFDLDASGRVMLYPVRTLASSIAAATTPLGIKRVGLQLVPGVYEAVTEVPKTGYDTLSVMTVSRGAVVAVELQDIAACQTSLGGYTLYAKLVIDSVQLGTRRIFGRSVVDPNCGYRQVVPDSIPKS